MNPLFSRMTRRYTPKMNESVMRGYATKVIPFLEEYIDAQIRSIYVGIHPCFRYVRYERCTPEEEYEEVIRMRSSDNKRKFDLAKTSKYLVRYIFEYTMLKDGVEVKKEEVKHVYLPYVKEGGLIMISGTENHLVPVLSDKVFTVNGNTLFVRLAQARNNFFRMHQTVRINGENVSRYIVHSEIYQNSSKNKIPVSDQVTRAKTILVHYLIARYGYTGAFQRYAQYVPVLGDYRTITPEAFPPDTWNIYESTRIQPKKTYIGAIYRPTPVRVAVPKTHVTANIEALIFGMFYVLDHFPDRMMPDFKEEEAHRLTDIEYVQQRYLEEFNDCSHWMILIGIIRFGGNAHNRLYHSIKEHFETIEPYLDHAAQAKLAENGLYFENYFDLLNFIQVSIDHFIVKNEKDGLCVYGKNLEILQPVAYDILYGFTMMKFKLNKAASRNLVSEDPVLRAYPITEKDVQECLRRMIKPGAIFRLTSDNKQVCEHVAYSGDHLYPKITSVVSLQESRGGGSRETNKRVIPGPEHWIDTSMVFAGSILNLPKTKPTPMVRINPFVTLDERTGTLIENPKFKALAEKNAPLFKL